MAAEVLLPAIDYESADDDFKASTKKPRVENLKNEWRT